MPAWLAILLGLLAAVGLIGAWMARVTDRQTLALEKLWTAQTHAAIAAHANDCAARGRALAPAEDDSGAVPSFAVREPSARWGR